MSDSYKLLILSSAAKELQSLREPNYSRIKQKILSLSSNPRPRGSAKLTGREGWRIRAGDYRDFRRYRFSRLNKQPLF